MRENGSKLKGKKSFEFITHCLRVSSQRLSLTKKDGGGGQNREKRRSGKREEENGEGERQGGERAAEGYQCTSWLVLQTLSLKGSICPSIQSQAQDHPATLFTAHIWAMAP